VVEKRCSQKETPRKPWLKKTWGAKGSRATPSSKGKKRRLEKKGKEHMKTFTARIKSSENRISRGLQKKDSPQTTPEQIRGKTNCIGEKRGGAESFAWWERTPTGKYGMAEKKPKGGHGGREDPSGKGFSFGVWESGGGLIYQKGSNGQRRRE